MERDLLTRGLIILGIAGLAAWSAFAQSLFQSAEFRYAG